MTKSLQTELKPILDKYQKIYEPLRTMRDLTQEEIKQYEENLKVTGLLLFSEKFANIKIFELSFDHQ